MRRRRHLGLLILVIVLVASLGLAWWAGRGRPPGAIGRLDPTTAFRGVAVQLVATGGDLWVLGENGTLGRHEQGTWWAYPPFDGQGGDVAQPTEGIPVVVVEHGLRRLAHGEWETLAGAARWIDAQPSTGVLWTMDDDGALRRYEGGQYTEAPPAPGREVGDIVATPDGDVWAGGLTIGYVQLFEGLVRYDDRTATWRSIRPWAGHGDVPALAMAVAPDGDLWALLADANSDPLMRLSWALAHLDSETGEWAVHEDLGLPGQVPAGLAADDDGVWIVQGLFELGDAPWPGASHFDGTSMTANLLQDRVVSSIGVGSDGSVWVASGTPFFDAVAEGQPGLEQLDTSGVDD